MSEPTKCRSAIEQAATTAGMYGGDGASGQASNSLKGGAGTWRRPPTDYTMPSYGVEMLYRRSYSAQTQLLTQVFAAEDRSAKAEAPPSSDETDEALRKCFSRNSQAVVCQSFPTRRHAGGFHG